MKPSYIVAASVYLLPVNIVYRYQSNMAKEVVDTIMSIQPKDSSGGTGETREAMVYRIANDMLEKLPPDYIPHEVKARLQKMGALSSMNIFLRQEIDRMQRVLSVVRHTLQDLKLAIDGTIIMSEVRAENGNLIAAVCLILCVCVLILEFARCPGLYV